MQLTLLSLFVTDTKEIAMKVIVTSNQHLGYANADKTSFNLFLDSLNQDNETTHLVLLGDVVDMWRRDASGVFLENRDTVEKLLGLGSAIKVYYVAGNHDYHVLDLKNHSYPFDFRENLLLPDGAVTYRFVHGYEYDPEQRPALMELLCRVLSDDAGSLESDFWKEWSNFVNGLFKIPSPSESNDLITTINRLQERPEVRLKSTLDEINARACHDAKPGQVLVFGHTHSPFVNKTENVVNSGSWVKDASPHNTYVELARGKPRLFVFGGNEITNRINC